MRKHNPKYTRRTATYAAARCWCRWAVGNTPDVVQVRVQQHIEEEAKAALTLRCLR